MPVEPHYSYTVRVKASLNERLQAYAVEHGMSVSKAITHCIEDTLEYEDKEKLEE